MPTLKEIEQSGEKRVDLMERILADFDSRLRRVQDWLFDALWEDVLKKIVVEGKVRKGLPSIRAVNTSPVWAKYYRRLRDEVTLWMVDMMGAKLTDSILSFFKLQVPATDLGTRTRSAANSLLTAMGYDGAKFVEGGALHLLTYDTTAERKVKALAIAAVASGRSLPAFKRDMLTIIKGDAGQLGIVERHFQTNANTAFAEFDRSLSGQLAEKYGMNYAIWSGPRMTTSRPFCLARKGKIFHKDEIVAMDKLKWQGKIPGQSTLLSAGGYNCSDILLWITDELAAQKKQNEATK